MAPPAKKARRSSVAVAVAAVTAPVKGVRVLACGDGSMGQLPTGRAKDKKPRAVDFTTLLGDAAEGLEILQIRAGGLHSLILLGDGRILSCGVNDEGALGRAGEEEGLGFVAGLPEPADPIVQIAAGDSYGAALATSGKVWAWGTFRGHNGQVGLCVSPDAKGHDHLTKVTKAATCIYAPESHSRKIHKMVGGGNHLALLTEGGELLTCGAGTCGQLGRISDRAMATYVEADLRLSKKMVTPGQVGKPTHATRFLNVWATSFATIVEVEMKGNAGRLLFGTGLHNHAQLGLAPTVKETEVATLTAMDALNAIYPQATHKGWAGFGGEHSLIGVHSDGRVWVLGRSEDARLGTAGESTAVSVPRELVLGGPVSAVAADSSSGFAVLESGAGRAWGFNNGGELGLGMDEDEESEPEEIKSLHLDGFRLVDVSAASTHTLFLAAKKP